MQNKIGHFLLQDIGRLWCSIWFHQSFLNNCSEIWMTHSLMLSESSITGKHLFCAPHQERWHAAFSTWIYFKLPKKNKTLSLFKNKWNGMETQVTDSYRLPNWVVSDLVAQSLQYCCVVKNVYSSIHSWMQRSNKLQTIPFCASTLFARKSLLDRNEYGKT